MEGAASATASRWQQMWAVLHSSRLSVEQVQGKLLPPVRERRQPDHQLTSTESNDRTAADGEQMAPGRQTIR